MYIFTNHCNVTYFGHGVKQRCVISLPNGAFSDWEDYERQIVDASDGRIPNIAPHTFAALRAVGVG